MEQEIYVKEIPKSCFDCPCFDDCRIQCNITYDDLEYIYKSDKDKGNKDCPLKSLHEYKKELVAKVLGMVRENLKEELLLTKNENQEEAKLKLVKTYSIDLDVLNKIEKEILNGYTKI